MRHLLFLLLLGLTAGCLPALTDVTIDQLDYDKAKIKGTLGLKSGKAFKGKGRQTVPSGERLLLQMPGGGGLGDAKTRDPGRVARDVVNGLVTPEMAKSAYGVVVDADGVVDRAATEALRAG